MELFFCSTVFIRQFANALLVNKAVCWREQQIAKLATLRAALSQAPKNASAFQKESLWYKSKLSQKQNCEFMRRVHLKE